MPSTAEAHQFVRQGSTGPGLLAILAGLAGSSGPLWTDGYGSTSAPTMPLTSPWTSGPNRGGGLATPVARGETHVSSHCSPGALHLARDVIAVRCRTRVRWSSTVVTFVLIHWLVAVLELTVRFPS